MAVATRRQPNPSIAPNGGVGAAGSTSAGAPTTSETQGQGSSSNSDPRTVPDAQVAGTGAAASGAGDATGVAASGSDSTPDWRSLVDTVTPAELLSHNRVAGIVGSAVQRLVDQRIQQVITEGQQRQKVEEENRLLDEDPEQYAALVKANRAALEQVQTVQSRVMNSIAAFQGTLPEEVQAKIRGKTYTGGATWEDNLQQYVRDVSETMADYLATHKNSQFQQDWEKDRVPALKKQWLAERNGGGRANSPEVNPGGSAPDGAITQDLFDANRRVPGWIRQNKRAIHQAMIAGHITY